MWLASSGAGGPVPGLWSLGDLTPWLPCTHRLDLSERVTHYLSRGSWPDPSRKPRLPAFVCPRRLTPPVGHSPTSVHTHPCWGGARALPAPYSSLRLPVCSPTPHCLGWPPRQAVSSLSFRKPGTAGSLRMARDWRVACRLPTVLLTHHLLISFQPLTAGILFFFWYH